MRIARTHPRISSIMITSRESTAMCCRMVASELGSFTESSMERRACFMESMSRNRRM